MIGFVAFRREQPASSLALLALRSLMLECIGHGCTAIGCSGSGLDRRVRRRRSPRTATLQIDIANVVDQAGRRRSFNVYASNGGDGAERLVCATPYLSLSETGAAHRLHTHEILPGCCRVTISSNGNVLSQQTVHARVHAARGRAVPAATLLHPRHRHVDLPPVAQPCGSSRPRFDRRVVERLVRAPQQLRDLRAKR